MNNLRIALQIKKIPIKEFANFLEVSESTAQNKLNGKTEFTYSEVMKISKLLFPEYKIEYLFDETA